MLVSEKKSVEVADLPDAEDQKASTNLEVDLENKTNNLSVNVSQNQSDRSKVAEEAKEEEFQHPKIKEFSELLEEYQEKFAKPFERHKPEDLEYLRQETSFFCKNHLRQKKNLFLCLNVDCPLKVFCKVCKIKKHLKCCSRINMDIKLDEIGDKEEILEFFDVENYDYAGFESEVRGKFGEIRETMNSNIDQMERLLLKKIRYESKEFRLKSIYETWARLVEEKKGGCGGLTEDLQRNIVDCTVDAAYQRFMFLQLVEIDELLDKEALVKQISDFSDALDRNFNQVLEGTIDQYMRDTNKIFLEEKEFWNKKFNEEYINKNKTNNLDVSTFRIDFHSHLKPETENHSKAILAEITSNKIEEEQISIIRLKKKKGNEEEVPQREQEQSDIEEQLDEEPKIATDTSGLFEKDKGGKKHLEGILNSMHGEDADLKEKPAKKERIFNSNLFDMKKKSTGKSSRLKFSEISPSASEDEEMNPIPEKPKASEVMQPKTTLNLSVDESTSSDDEEIEQIPENKEKPEEQPETIRKESEMDKEKEVALNEEKDPFKENEIEDPKDNLEKSEKKKESLELAKWEESSVKYLDSLSEESSDEETEKKMTREKMLEKCTNLKNCLTKNRIHLQDNELLFIFKEVLNRKDFTMQTKYRMSKGKSFKIHKFNKACSEDDNTIVFCKTKNRNVFGGFNHDPWDQMTEESTRNVIFSVTKQTVHQFNPENDDSIPAFTYNSDLQLAFGYEDLVIGDNCGLAESCSSRMGQAYEFNEDGEETYLAGQPRFKLEEICILKCEFYD